MLAANFAIQSCNSFPDQMSIKSHCTLPSPIISFFPQQDVKENPGHSTWLPIQPLISPQVKGVIFKSIYTVSLLYKCIKAEFLAKAASHHACIKCISQEIIPGCSTY